MLIVSGIKLFGPVDVCSIGFDGDLLMGVGMWVNIFEIITVSIEFMLRQKCIRVILGGLFTVLPSQILFHSL